MTSSDLPHWSFALAVYAEDGVAAACLRLQDELGVDVSLLLFALYAAAERGFVLDPQSVAALDGVTASWRNDVVATLRSLRRRLKGGPPPAPSPETETLRSAIKRAELDAEKIELAALAEWLRGWPHAAPAHAPDLRAVVEDLARHFARDLPPEALEQSGLPAARAQIAEAAARVAALRRADRR